MAEGGGEKLDVYKVALCGKSGVGKTSIFHRVLGNGFKKNTLEFKHLPESKVEVQVKEKTIIIHLWDTAGMERHKALTRPHYQGSHAVFLVYDCDETESLNQIETYYKDAKKHTNGAAMVLVRNKIDQECCSVEKEDAEKILCNHIEKGFPHCKFQHKAETSAKADTGIRELIQSVAEYLVQNAEPSNLQNEFEKIKQRNTKQNPGPSSRCC